MGIAIARTLPSASLLKFALFFGTTGTLGNDAAGGTTGTLGTGTLGNDAAGGTTGTLGNGLRYAKV